MAPKEPRYAKHERRPALPAPYLKHALSAVEGRLHVLYSRLDDENPGRRVAIILAGSDPQSPIWDELMQVSYLENAREGLLSTLQALPNRPGRRT